MAPSEASGPPHALCTYRGHTRQHGVVQREDDDRPVLGQRRRGARDEGGAVRAEDLDLEAHREGRGVGLARPPHDDAAPARTEGMGQAGGEKQSVGE